MPLNIEKEVTALEQMTAGQLAERYAELFGVQTHSRHRTYLIRKIAWRLQTRAQGDLSERARKRAEELADDTELRTIGQSVGTIGQSVGLLTSLSMIGLGVSVLSQVHIAFQFAALTRRIATIDRRVQAIQEMLIQEHRARLANGINDLRQAGEVAATDLQASRQFTYDAHVVLAGSRASYSQQLSDQLSRSTPEESAYLWMLARHLTTATLGETTCHLRLNQPQQGVGVLRSGLEVLQRHAAVVFNRTIAANPTRFLMPAMVEHGITLEVLAELYRQARHAEVLDNNQQTAADLFEFLRDRLSEASNPRFGKVRKVQQLRAEFTEASTAIEEVNRLRGLALAIEQYDRSGQNYLTLTEQILSDIAARRPENGTCFAVFPPIGG